MSHNAALGSPPHVLSVSPVNIIAAGATTITINGNNLSTSCRLEIPAALGTVTGPGVYTAATGTQGDLVFPITALAPPGTPTARACTFSNGGMASTGVAIEIWHGWDPSALCTGSTDYWWNPDYITGVVDGASVGSFTDSANGLVLIEGTGSNQPQYVEAHTWSTGKTAAALSCSGDHFKDTVIPISLTGGAVEITVAYIVKAITVSSWMSTVIVGGADNAKRFGVGLTSSRAYNWAPSGGSGSNNTNTAISWAAGDILTPVLTGAGGSSTLTIPELSLTLANTYLEASSVGSSSTSVMFETTNGLAMYGECLVISRALDAGEITLLRDYWDDKYGS